MAATSTTKTQKAIKVARVSGRLMAGRDLDGKRRTDHRWAKPGTQPLTPHGYASRWAHYPQRRRSGVRMLMLTGLILAVYGAIINPAATAETLRVLVWVGLAIGGWVTWEKGRRYVHRRELIAPLGEVLAAHFGDAKYTLDPRAFIHVPVDVNDRPTVIDLPKLYIPTDAQEKALVRLVARKIGLSHPTATFELHGEKPFMELRPAPAPRELVPFTDPAIKAMVESCTDGKPMLGLAPRDVPYHLDLEAEGPHPGFSMATNTGKSTAARALIMQVLHEGGLALILDRKQVSQAWCKGLPNVRYASSPQEIHEALLWLSEEVDRRFAIIDKNADLRGYVDPDLIGPRLIVAAEELNTLEQDVSAYWRTIRVAGQPLKAPSLAALGRGMAMGRQGRVNVMPIGQKITAQSIGGTAARENMSTRVLGRATTSTWNMLAPECKIGGRYPRMSKIRGRVHVVFGDEATLVQVLKVDEQEARDYATSGIVAVFPTEGHVMSQTVLGQRSKPVDHRETERPRTATVTRIGAQPDPITLVQAIELGIYTGTLDALRRASTRDGFPPSIGVDGVAKTYDSTALDAWAAPRRSGAEASALEDGSA